MSYLWEVEPSGFPPSSGWARGVVLEAPRVRQKKCHGCDIIIDKITNIAAKNPCHPSPQTLYPRLEACISSLADLLRHLVYFCLGF